MASILLAVLLLLQDVPVRQGGTVTGVLRDTTGMPLPGVRMAAMMRPDSLNDIAEGTASLYAETDAEGKYTLEDIPAGRYVIAAGRLDLQTFYPGTQEIAQATVVSITPGATISDMNFILNSTSLGRSPTGSGGTPVNATVPVRVTVENGGKLPISANGKFVSIRLESSRSPISVPVDSASINVPGPTTMDFRVSVEGLPEDYAVKSIMYGTTDVTRSSFRLTPSNFPVPVLTMGLNTSPTGAPPGTALTASEVQLLTSLNALAQSSALRSQPYPTVSVANRFVPASMLSITLAVTQTAHTKARVTGRLRTASKRLVYISGNPGFLYSEGTFEFRDVPPGLHTIATVNSPSTPLAGLVVVGDKDVDNVELKETILLPADVRVPKNPLPAGNYPAGSLVPLARVSGIVLEETTKEPVREGELAIKSGDILRMIPIDDNGRFEPFSLLPGIYEIRFQIFGHSSAGPELVVEDKDLDLQLTSRRLY